MAKKSMIAKAKRKQRFGVRSYHRCFVCGRSRAYINGTPSTQGLLRELADLPRVHAAPAQAQIEQAQAARAPVQVLGLELGEAGPQRRCCPFSGRPIGIRALFSADVEMISKTS